MILRFASIFLICPYSLTTPNSSINNVSQLARAVLRVWLQNGMVKHFCEMFMNGYSGGVVGFFLACAVVSASVSACDAGPITIVDVSKGDKIDTEGSKKAIETLQKSSGAEREASVEMIKKNPGDYAPPVLFELSRVLFEAGNADDAMFWFYAAQLRTRFDANRCADHTARSAFGVLTRAYGPPIVSRAMREPETITRVAAKVLAWDESTPYNYDHRWINLHGMATFTPDPSRATSAPVEKWQEIAASTRQEFRTMSEKVAAIGKTNQMPLVVADKPLGYKGADGSVITEPTECSKKVAETSMCKACCGAVEPHLTEAQAAEVARDLKSLNDVTKFNFPIPEPYVGCLSSCGFAEIARQIVK